MPTSIPYNPKLVLTSVVDAAAMKNVQDISNAQAPVDAAEQDLNSLISSRRSLDMTVTELRNLGIDPVDVTTAITALNANIVDAAKNFANEKITAEKTISGLRAQMPTVNSNVESPVDLVKSQIKSMPIAADSLNMDVQYFSYDQNKQDSSAYAGTIAGYISGSSSFLGEKAQAQLSTSAATQVAKQLSQHSIEGTLVLSVSCTHKNAYVLAPFILNVDKAIKVYNRVLPSKALDPTDKGKMAQIAASSDSNATDNAMQIISGVTFGSSFVGMVHILKADDAQVSDALTSMAASLQYQQTAGNYLANASGGFGIDDSFSKSLKNLLSHQSITSHVTLLCQGVIPSVVASDVKLEVAKFNEFDPQTTMSQIAAIQNDTVGDQATVASAATQARTGEAMIAIESAKIKATLSTLGQIDDGSNKVLDINSLMTALDDYLKKAAQDTCGVPINYYLKDITDKMLAEMWVAKYYPGEYMSIKYDDSANDNPNPNAKGGNTSGSGSGAAPSGGTSGT